MLSTKVMLYAEANGVNNVDFPADVLLVCEAGVESIKEWNLDIPKPDDATLAQYETQAEAQEALGVVQSKRAAEYPSLAEQLDMQYHDSINGTTTWADAIQAVKDKYPKPE
mgnify:CR=1 FL=1